MSNNEMLLLSMMKTSNELTKAIAEFYLMNNQLPESRIKGKMKEIAFTLLFNAGYNINEIVKE